MVGFASIQGKFEVVQQSHYKITLDFQATRKVAVLKNENISSISSKDTKKICNELKKKIGCTVKMSFKDNNEQKFAKLDKVRTVKKHGKDVLRVTASSDEFNTTGRFARDVTDLDKTPKTFEATVDFISSQDPAAAACALDRANLGLLINSPTSEEKDDDLAKFATTYLNLYCGSGN